MDLRRRQLLQHLEAAATAYGGDLPLAVPPPTADAKGSRADARRADASRASSAKGNHLEGSHFERSIGAPMRQPPAPPPRAALRTALPPAAPAPSPAPGPAGPAVADADPAQLLATLRAEVLACRKCKLCEHRRAVVFGEGSPRPPVLFIGEAPGAVEDQTGRPFVGPAGQLLDRILQGAMGLRREAVFIANVNKCRPPGNRDPEPDEVAACLPYLRQQVAILRPRAIVALGRIAAHNLLGTKEPMRALRGRDLSYEGIPVVVTWHPAFLLRDPSHKRETWEDIKRVNRILGLPEVPGREVAGDAG